ncbi:CsoS2 family carboxysome shell protein [Leucothrix pacifica]|uniref:Carboxysome shell protein n=1 Tax=Leucothrix pacifica TaxID=1247513 RepID=A0A317CQX7_9GAMM|nr:CsoS2 family carboxysome shell protein [Leucothrix pacifica]PWR00598.1 carboxysome shell protein [Leucothrix pacifica]
MPALSSADKKQQAHEARRQAALKSAQNRRRRERPAAVQTQSQPAAKPESAPAAETLADTVLSAPASMSVELSDAGSSEVDELCEIVESNPTALGSDLNNVRQLCRNRRKALSSKGKAAVPSKSSALGRGGNAARAMAFAAGQINGRDLAKLRRSEMASKGRGDAPVSRPSGRVRPTVAPPKVEVGTTLAGHEVSGTQVERTTAVTGNEQGTCRAITGTEYVGTEQFASFCGTKPEPNTPKVALSITGGGNAVSGTEVGRSHKVTGDEQGSCVSVTGSEYIGADKMANFCGVQPSAKPAKVMSGRSEKTDTRITGVDEARMNATGSEAGANNRITGSQYADMGAAKMTINGPSKVALTHTIAGQAITGTEVGRSAAVTGDEYGSCRPVTGTEYISNEQFASVCGTIAAPHPAKVGVDNSLQGQRITGALVDRTEKVTGNEPGSCTHLTGTQYGESKLCGGAAPKVNNMHTLNGGHLTGNSIDLSPKMTGDEQGGCLPVTGYYGQEQFAHCPSTPVAAPAKVGVDHTPKGEHVSGTMLGAVGNVTGNEHGAQLPVSGTPYAGIQAPQHHGSCCDSCAVRDAAAAAGLVAPTHHHAAQVSQPQATQAYAQQPSSVPAQQYPVQQAVQAAPPVAPQDFSIVSPARAAQITGSHGGYHDTGRVTGPGDLATNRVSGTPEFRYPDTRQMAAPAPAPIMAAPAQLPVQQANFAPAEPAPMPQQAMAQPQQQVMMPVEQAPAMHSQRITGEGREGGFTVSGDNWGRAPGMTGTEGHVAQGRNPTLRVGEMQQPVNNAYHNKGMERPEVPAARVTGSSGNSAEGAVITVSGGARG